MKNKLPLVVLISGNGSNLQAIIDAAQQGSPFDIRGVISNQEDAYGLKRAKNANIPTQIISHKHYSKRNDFDNVLKEHIDKYQPRLIVLAGFMRILGPSMTHYYTGKILNIHPSLLPHYQGLNTHARVIEANEKEHGCSIHFVTEQLDAGPIIAQAKTKITFDDSPQSLQLKVQTLEHQLYPEVLRWFAADRIELMNDLIYLDKQPLPSNGFLCDFL